MYKQAIGRTTSIHNQTSQDINDVVDDLGSRDEVNYVMKILQMGTGADRQLAKWDGTQEGFKKVVDYIIEETHLGLD